jgi:hypothetical protein
MQYSVVTVVHQAIRQRSDLKPFPNHAQQPTELDTISVGKEHHLTIHAAVHHVVSPVVDINPRHPSHAAIFSNWCHRVPGHTVPGTV